MKTVKLQSDILKALDKGKMSDYAIGDIDDDTVGVCIKGLMLVFVPKKSFYLDIDKAFPNVINMTMFLKNERDAVPLEDANIIELNVNTIKSCKVFYMGDTKIDIDEKNLQYFDTRYCSYKGTARNNGVYVYEDDKLVGYVLPVNYWSEV